MQTHFIHEIKRGVLLSGFLLLSACRTVPATATEAPDETPYTVRNKITSITPHQAQVHKRTHPLTAHPWRLKQATDSNGQRIGALFVDESRPLTVEFRHGRVHLSHTCNAMSSTYTLDAANDSLNIGSFMGTMMACPQPLMALDRAINQRLEGALKISIEGNELRIQNEVGDILVFRE